MRRLHLLRHAKSSWELAGQLDHARGLTPRGRDDIELISKQLKSSGVSPDLIICSSARRTAETLAGLDASIVKDAKVKITDDAYQASTSDLLELLRAVKPKHDSVMLIGHNPSIHDLAVDLASGGEELEKLAAKFPTAALAEFKFDGDWSELDSDGAELVSFTTPKQLR